MSESHTAAHPRPARTDRFLAPMRARSPHESHRASTPLELLFDLVFVVAIAEAGSELHHAISAGHAMSGLTGYLMVFFAIWWAWMNFTWFASAYDCDDLPYRVAVFVQITGALILAAGVPAMFEQQNLKAILVGYVVMRFAMVAQWLRAAAADPERRRTAHRYAVGVAAVQLAWLGMLLVSRFFMAAFLFLVMLELLVPVWAERTGKTTWHPQHIAERYALLTLIVLGESILSANLAMQSALGSGEALSTLLPLIIGGLLIVFSMWWVYFDRPVHDLLISFRVAIFWGYGHYLVFAAAAAVGAGLAVAVDQVTHHAAIGAAGAGAAVAIPVAVYLLSLWVLHDRPAYRQSRAFGPVAAGLILLSPLTGQAVPLTGLILAGMIGVKLVIQGRPAG